MTNTIERCRLWCGHCRNDSFFKWYRFTM